MDKVLEARNDIFYAETHLRQARESLDKALAPKSERTEIILRELSIYKLEVIKEGPNHVVIHLQGNQISAENAFKRILDETGLYVGCVDVRLHGIEIRFFTHEFSSF